MFGHPGEGAAGGELTFPVVVLTVLYSLAGLGIAIVNDFKSIEGDRELGLRSLPVAFGIDGAKRVPASSTRAGGGPPYLQVLDGEL